PEAGRAVAAAAMDERGIVRWLPDLAQELVDRRGVRRRGRERNMDEVDARGLGGGGFAVDVRGAFVGKLQVEDRLEPALFELGDRLGLDGAAARDRRLQPREVDDAGNRFFGDLLS